MIRDGGAAAREPRTVRLEADLVVVGGGLAGTCCAITAARAGARVVLVQDRPVLGGNASSEVRLWALGATAHMTNNNRWAREGGVIDELLTENTWRNPEGNAVLFDSVVLDAVLAESNLALLLNTAVHAVDKDGSDRIAGVRAFCSQNSTAYDLRAPLFCDASGDGIVGFLAGAAFRMGAEAEAEFGEKFAPSREYGELLGHSIYFYSKDTGHPVTFVPPSWALKDVPGRIPRHAEFDAKQFGPHLWWIEYGGRLDTVHETETIKWELWKVVYGVWDWIKNSGKFPEAANRTLEWVGLIPGKRESRRFEGPVLLNQHDIIEQRVHPDDVSFGGWSIDLHPADGIYSEKPGCDQWHAKGVYPIPYRCLYSRNLDNLFLAGRIISATHVAFGSTRVMCTLAEAGQAVGVAAATCAREGLKPADVTAPARMHALQRDLLRQGQYIPGVALDDPRDLARAARVSATSELRLSALPPDGPWLKLEHDWAQMLPVAAGPAPRVTFTVRAEAPVTLTVEVRQSSKPFNHTPDETLTSRGIALPAGESAVTLEVPAPINGSHYLFYCLLKNEQVAVRLSESRVTGLVAVEHAWDQTPEHDIGVETFGFWIARRAPEGQNLACTIEPPIALFGPDQARNGVGRPVAGPNAWVAAPGDPSPALTLTWDTPQTIARVELEFDTDWDHPMETVLFRHHARAMPSCVKRYRLRDTAGRVVHESGENHHARNTVRLDPPLVTAGLTVELLETWGPVPKALFAVRCFPD